MINKLLENFRNNRSSWIFWGIAVAGLLLRMEYLRQYAGQVYSAFAIGADVQEYDQRAHEILHGIFFPETPEIHGPLYSWVLALFYRFSGGSLIAVRALQLMLNWAAYIALAKLIKRLGGSEKLQHIFLALSMFVPVIFFHQGEIISETLLAPLFAGFLWCRVSAEEKSRCKLLLASGVMLGSLILTHGIMSLFAIAELIRELVRKQFKTAAILFAGIAMLVAPVIIAKSCFYGKFCWVQDNGAYNFWIGCNPDATGGCYLRPGKMWSRPLEAAKASAAELGVSESRIFLIDSGKFILNEPGKALLLPLKKLCLLFAPWEPIAGADPEELIRRTPIQRAGSGMFLALTLLGVTGIYFAIRKKYPNYIHFYLLSASVAATLLLTVVSGRYRQGLIPGLILLAAIAVYHLGKKSWLIIAPSLLAGIIIFPIRHPAISGYAEAASIEGEAYYRLEDWENAKHFLLIAEAAIDNPQRFDNMLGAIAERNGEIDEARLRYSRAVASDPTDADSLLNLGHLYFFHFPDKRLEALSCLRDALEQNPNLPSAYDMFGIHLAQNNDIPGALQMFESALRCDPDNELYQNKVNLCRQILARKRGENAPESSHP